MAGVAPEHQNRNIGYQLKLAQRDHVLAQGMDLVTWTFDPLQSRNAYFNFHKLGVICKTYRRNLYGDLTDALSGGIPTDRFKVEWHVKAPIVADRLSGAWPGFSLAALQADQVPAIEGTLRGDLLCPPETLPRFEAQRMLVQIPSSIGGIKARDLGVARAWVDHLRAVFETAFSKGYVAVDCLYEGGRSMYVLDRESVTASRQRVAPA
jgi:predicted GNAT superfamily acetyltransferase